ncbi:DUF3488 and transglutaminase-like domain-containing protein [soil metagenome]
MTATLDRPAPSPPEPAVPGAPQHQIDRWAEGSLVLVTLAATIAFGRLFDAGGALVPLVLAAVVAHVVAATTRRRGLGPAATAATLGAGFCLQASVTLYPHTSFLGLPTGATLASLGTDLDRAWLLYAETTAPAPASRGFLLAVTFALWVTAGLSDWAAFRLQTTAEAVLPAVALFTFTAILGESVHGVALTAVLAATILAFAVVQRARRSDHRDAWVGPRSARGTSTLVRVGLATAVACALLAALFGPRVPGAESEALVDLTGGDGPSSRMTVSPLVDIRSRLVQQSDAVAFRVVADLPAYWRLTSLDQFNGQAWSSSGSFSKADGLLPSEPPEATTTPVQQTFTIESLSTIWAPAALTPIQIDESDTALRWNGGLATLIVPAAQDSIDQSTYTVTSAVPSFTPEDLDRPRTAALSEALEDATRLPADIPPLVQSQARQVVNGVGSGPYAQALALQDWFRSTFTYDLAGTGAGHDERAIETFLEARRGYCEQFAGTSAAMARSLGLPARVAVGFTPGEVDDDGTTYTVRGRNAHAWPEVHIEGAGWVPFEPTPGRGQPGTEAYTGVAPAQDTQDGAPAPPPTTVPTAETPPPSEDRPQPSQDDLLAGGSSTASEEPTGRSGPGASELVLLALAALVALLALDVAALAGVRAARRRRRRQTTAVAGRVRAAWTEAVDALIGVGHGPRAAETDEEFARRAATRLGSDGPALVSLAGLVTTATWAPAGSGPEADVADEATSLARRITTQVADGRDWRQRVRALVDPRPLLASRRR